MAGDLDVQSSSEFVSRDSSESFAPRKRRQAARKQASKLNPVKAIRGKKKLAKQRPSATTDSEEICVVSKDPLTGEETFYCRPCEEFFESGQALGGHMSRVHPG